MQIGWQVGRSERKTGVAGSTARAAQAVALGVQLHLLLLTAQQDLEIGCGAGQSPRKRGAVHTKVRGAQQYREVAHEEFGS